MSLLSIIVEVTGRLGLVQPSAVVGSTDPQVKQLYALANKSGRDLAQAYNWQALLEQQTFVTTATPTQASAVPSDFDRFVPNSFFNRSTMRGVAGPLTPQQWQALQAIPALNTVYLMYRMRTGAFLMSPTPPAGQTIAYEYVSKNWAQSALLVAQSQFLADTDTSFLDEGLIADSLAWRFLAAKGLAYDEAKKTYTDNLDQIQGRDGGTTQLSMSPRPINYSRVNLPDGNWPG